MIKFNLSVLIVFLFSFHLHAQEMHTVMTFNIKYDDPDLTANHWDKRKDVEVGLVNFHHPDVAGLQEAEHHQVKYFAKNLKHYDWVGVGRQDGKKAGEYTPIFFNNRKLKILEHNTFWLSESPSSPSKSWDAALPRICTWAHFENKATGERFYVFNTHFDHRGEQARLESARLITQKVESIAGNAPAVVIGDFNFTPDDLPYPVITNGGLRDSKKVSKIPPYGPEGTSNGFDYNSDLKKRIDYVFVNDQVTVQRYGVLTDSYNRKYPSDHLPVMVEYTF